MSSLISREYSCKEDELTQRISGLLIVSFRKLSWYAGRRIEITFGCKDEEDDKDEEEEAVEDEKDDEEEEEEAAEDEAKSPL